MPQPPLVTVMGVSGSGKTTVGAALAQRLGVPFADADDFHPPENVAKMSAGTPLDDDDRLPWLHAIGRWLAEHAPSAPSSAARRCAAPTATSCARRRPGRCSSTSRSRRPPRPARCRPRSRTSRIDDLVAAAARHAVLLTTATGTEA